MNGIYHANGMTGAAHAPQQQAGPQASTSNAANGHAEAASMSNGYDDAQNAYELSNYVVRF
jgi:hypothetical protein